MSDELLRVEGLTVGFRSDGRLANAVDGVSFELRQGEKLGLVGESGSGKSVTGHALTRLGDRRGAHIDPASRIVLDGVDVVRASEAELRRLRRSVASMIFQDPLGALNPMYTIEHQVGEAIELRQGRKGCDVHREVLELLDKVGLRNVEHVARSYPHQLSGGMRQRVVIAIALASRPRLLLADEPTTALDVTVQKRIVELLDELVTAEGLSILFISHDLPLVGSLVDRVMVMYAGKVVENGTVDEIFATPAHPYSRGLLAAAPGIDGSERLRVRGIPGAPPRIGAMPTGCRFHPRCQFATQRCVEELPLLGPVRGIGNLAACHHVDEVLRTPIVEVASEEGPDPRAHSRDERRDGVLVEVRDVSKTFAARGRRSAPLRAVDQVSLEVHSGDSFGIVGESGSGKSTLALMMAALEPTTSGHVVIGGRRLDTLRPRDRRSLRRDLQVVFQDPTASLDPRLTVRRLLREPLDIHRIRLSRTEREDRLVGALERVGLSGADLARYPGEFSGGQRQRIAIARALILEPRLIILDEPVSSLDVSVRAEIVDLLQRLRRELDLTYVFIAHDLALVRNFCNRVAVMSAGQVVEIGSAEEVLGRPQHPYTQELLRSVPAQRVPLRRKATP